MKKLFKKWIIFFVIIAIMVVILSGGLFKKLQIMNKLDYDITLNKDGSMRIVETWDIYISHTNTLFRTFDITNKFGNIENVKVKDLQTGKDLTQIYKEMYHVTDNCFYALKINSHEFEVAWGTGMENKIGKKKYQFSYTITDVITEYKDCQELYWKLLDESNTIPVKKITGTIKLPNGVKNTNNLKVWGHGPLNGKIEIASNNTIKFDIKNLKKGKMLEIRNVATEKLFEVSSNKFKNYNYLQKIINEETEWVNTSNEITRIFYMIVFVIYITAIIINVLKCLIYYKISKKENDGIIHTDLKYFRDIPRENENTPSQAGYIYYFNKDVKNLTIHQSDFVAATILDLSLKKYIDLNVENSKIYVKILKSKDGLSGDEAAIYKLLKETGRGQEIFEIGSIKDFAHKKYNRYNSIINEFVKSSMSNLYNKKLIDKGDKKKYEKSKNAKYNYKILMNILQFVIIAFVTGLLPIFNILYLKIFGVGYQYEAIIIALILLPLILSIILKLKYLSKAQNKISVLTQEGVKEQEQLIALANYMKDFSKLNEKDVPSLVLWEKYLVYATAFGIAEKVIAQMRAKYPEVFIKEYWENEDNIANYQILRFAVNNIVYYDTTSFGSPISTLSSNASSAYGISLSEIAAHSSSSGSGRRWRIFRWWPEAGGGGGRNGRKIK